MKIDSQNIKVTGWQFNEDETAIHADATCNDLKIQVYINREMFENHLTNGTGMYEYSLPVLQGNEHVDDKIEQAPVAEFWNEGTSAILAEIWGYLNSTPAATSELISSFAFRQLANELRAAGLSSDVFGKILDAATVYAIAQYNHGSDKTSEMYRPLTSKGYRTVTIVEPRTQSINASKTAA